MAARVGVEVVVRGGVETVVATVVDTVVLAEAEKEGWSSVVLARAGKMIVADCCRERWMRWFWQKAEKEGWSSVVLARAEEMMVAKAAETVVAREAVEKEVVME